MANGSVTDDQAHVWLQVIADSGWISLHYDNPAMGDAERAEISGGSYQRFKMHWNQPNNRSIWSLIDARFNGLQQSKLTYFGVWDSSVKGMLRAYGELPKPEAVLNGGGYVLHAGLIAISFG
jgi:hypothetical protein